MKCGEFVVMPNHFHCIMGLNDMGDDIDMGTDAATTTINFRYNVLVQNNDNKRIYPWRKK
jgi:hypothetical protein